MQKQLLYYEVEDTGTWWDAKTGTWPFVESVTEARTMTKDIYRAYLVENVPPAIVATLLVREHGAIKLQQDNTHAFVTPDDTAQFYVFDQYKVRGWTFALTLSLVAHPSFVVLALTSSKRPPFTDDQDLMLLRQVSSMQPFCARRCTTMDA
ncbi:Aste57867_18493 [Aphanomyces stellatus]|uniref:Aste57867_18493 protein n=1 Tax=Aphanomyces stellatus TaxID=120398 RepID=A0A485LAU2_9STRA|nr:hypothetical protein As57867_018431 [Aphanomyces stellatus]VFT95229.1 Aste57867_18493 [Aphanomyces stellatus]